MVYAICLYRWDACRAKSRRTFSENVITQSHTYLIPRLVVKCNGCLVFLSYLLHAHAHQPIDRHCILLAPSSWSRDNHTVTRRCGFRNQRYMRVIFLYYAITRSLGYHRGGTCGRTSHYAINFSTCYCIIIALSRVGVQRTVCSSLFVGK